MNTSERRYDLDWLRVIAFFILVYFHAAITFIPGGLPLIQNAQTSEVLHLAVDFLHQFRLSLLFLISGVGIAFARRHRNTGEFIAERSKRLIIPFLFAMLVVIPPMVYMEKRFLGQFEGNFWQFYPQFFIGGVYPKGNLSWHHFWFIVYLYLFCLLGIRIFSYLDAAASKFRLQGNSHGIGIYLYILPLALVEISLRGFFPGFRDLIHDWASFLHWFLVFLAGYGIAVKPDLLDDIAKLRHFSLLGGVISTILLFVLFRSEQGSFTPVQGDHVTLIDYVLFCALRAANIWFWLLICLGYAGHYLRFSTPILSYLNQAVYPLFILHLTVIIFLSYWIVSIEMNLWIKYLIVSNATMLLVLLFYHFFIRPFNLMRVLHGVKKRVK